MFIFLVLKYPRLSSIIVTSFVVFKVFVPQVITWSILFKRIQAVQIYMEWNIKVHRGPPAVPHTVSLSLVVSTVSDDEESHSTELPLESLPHFLRLSFALEVNLPWTSQHHISENIIHLGIALKNHRIVHFESIDLMVCEFYLI